MPPGNVILGGGRGIADRVRQRALPIAATTPAASRQTIVAFDIGRFAS